MTNSKRNANGSRLLGNWKWPELLAVLILTVMLLLSVMGFLGAASGWWETPNPGVDPYVRHKIRY